ncbi:uncharacterized protein [Haliotis asinina]|uniref:uncharacterized protein n=1 Tax=Haliotis asinina TaxID=109174 RepID=UPI0035319208
MTMGDTAVMDIIRLAQNGQNLYTQGNVTGALEEFKKAYELAAQTDSISVKETCLYNLATAYATNRKGKNALECLQKLSKSYLDTLNEGELTFIRGLAEQHSGRKQSQTVFLYKKALNQLNLLQSNMNASLKKYILEQLCELEQDNEEALIDYKQQLSGVYGYLKCPLKEIQMLCDVANLLFTVNAIDKAYSAAADCMLVVHQLGRTVTIKGEPDLEIRRTTEKCLEVADSAVSPQYLVPILNEIGLLFTQLREMDRALECFNQARQMLSYADNNVRRNEAVIIQNIGAVHNFKSVDNKQAAQTALKFHEEAISKYGHQKTYKAQGHCHVNKAYAESVMRDISGAQEAYLLALTTAKTGGDIRTQWQSLEGLGAVACHYKDNRKAEKYYKEALELVHKDERDASQASACDRILEKLLALRRGGLTTARQGGFDHTGSGLGTKTLQSFVRGSRSAEMKEVDRKLTKREIRELKVRRSGSLRQFPKVAYGLASSTPDPILQTSEDSDDSSSTTSSSSSSSPSSTYERPFHVSRYPYSKVARPREDERKVIVQRNISKRPASGGSFGTLRRSSDRGLQTTLLDMGGTSEEEQGRAVRKAMSRLISEDSPDENETPRTPRVAQVNGHHHADQQEQKRAEEDDHEEDEEELEKKEEEKEQPSSSRPESALKTAMKRDEYGLSHTKSLRFRKPTVDSSDDEDNQEVNHREQVKVDVHHEKQPRTDDSRESESEETEDSESDSDSERELSHEETDIPGPPPVPTQSPPASPSNTYETPVAQNMRQKSLYKDDKLRESTGQYAEIDFGTSASEFRQGETSRSESTVYETIRTRDSGETQQLNNAAQSGDNGGTARSERYSGDESEMETDRGLSRAEREQQMLKYHHQYKQDEAAPQEEPQGEPQGMPEGAQEQEKKSRTCVIS